MHQIMFPLLIMNILENHATREHPLTITEITEFVNREFLKPVGTPTHFPIPYVLH